MRETEVKFYVQDLNGLRTRLEELGARLVQERVLEINIRYDLPDAQLRAEGRVLRLRRDTEARLTYKSASQKQEGILSREEIEFVVEDFEKAKRFLEALGYRKLVYYEKYRATYDLYATHIMLDELPYGNFIEIEGESIETIHRLADELHLHWGAAVATSYLALFERARRVLNFSFEDLAFENFRGMHVGASHLEVQAADR
jgi:adenylate cyclase class 2